MAEPGNIEGVRLELEAVRRDARNEARSLKKQVKAWRVLACGSDVVAIALGALAAATAAVALGDVVTAASAGVAAAAAGFDATVRPGQLAAREADRQGKWANVESQADQTIGGLQGLDDAQADKALEAVQRRQQQLEKQDLQRKDYAPLAW
jgi:hypothetical protein